jgi:hypothetical protein
MMTWTNRRAKSIEFVKGHPTYRRDGAYKETVLVFGMERWRSDNMTELTAGEFLSVQVFTPVVAFDERASPAGIFIHGHFLCLVQHPRSTRSLTEAMRIHTNPTSRHRALRVRRGLTLCRCKVHGLLAGLR